MSYDEEYNLWRSNPSKYWEKKAHNIIWNKKWTKVLDESSSPFWSWFPEAELNTCYNCLDFHINNGKGNKLALVYDSPITGQKKSYTYSDLLNCRWFKIFQC